MQLLGGLFITVKFVNKKLEFLRHGGILVCDVLLLVQLGRWRCDERADSRRCRTGARCGEVRHLDVLRRPALDSPRVVGSASFHVLLPLGTPASRR